MAYARAGYDRLPVSRGEWVEVDRLGATLATIAWLYPDGQGFTMAELVELLWPPVTKATKVVPYKIVYAREAVPNDHAVEALGRRQTSAQGARGQTPGAARVLPCHRRGRAATWQLLPVRYARLLARINLSKLASCAQGAGGLVPS